MTSFPRSVRRTAICSARTKARRTGCSGCSRSIKIGGADTTAQYGLVEITVRAGEGSPWHVHPDEDEWFYVLEGEFTFYVGEERLSLPAGSFAFGPKGVPHTFIAEATERGRWSASALPVRGLPARGRRAGNRAGAAAAARGRPDMERLLPIAARNGMDILGPPGPPPAADAATATQRARSRDERRDALAGARAPVGAARFEVRRARQRVHSPFRRSPSRRGRS